jgi:hypothetical protein
MTKVTQNYHKIEIDQSVALVKDKETKVKNWRHRFVHKSRKSNASGRQDFKDYPFKRFKDIKAFESYIKTENEKNTKEFNIDG